MSKRGNGYGTIYFSEKLNKLVGRFTAGRKTDGKINRKSVYGNTRKEVREKMAKALADISIQKIQVFQLQDFINKQKYYANSYIDKIYEMLGSIFKEAINRDIIVKNPLNNVLKPKSNKLYKKIESFSVEEQKAFVET